MLIILVTDVRTLFSDVGFFGVGVDSSFPS